ncbi:MAG TPA: ABC transporter permease [Anaerolinea thermolimosa]|uniref:ABC transporter permease n=1 Tax=Anaerolinea thermolimosa TaxID=229919 RepID=A0A3D1JJ22_9CHLR|nr:ABC transporter permease [Anaerolinea thermolimosa]GAP05417.1 nucleoside ABC transporter membrane protein [Anaerolinea thermolimosa]HCE18227.1 ABC transporter permease [Anaerolinea thermolimosa]
MEIFLVGWVAATLRVATPLIFGTLGELFSERSGVLNLGIEGTMFLGAFIGFTVASKSGSLWLGFFTAVLVGMLSGWLMALLAVRLGVNQHVAGLGMTLLWTGFSLFGFRLIFGEPKVPPSITPFQSLSILPDSTFLGPVINQHGLTYVAFLLIPLTGWVLHRTRFGLNVRAVGENPEAADAAGLDVYQIRTLALMIGGGLMAGGGAFLSLAQLGAFTYGIVAGRGWVCIALIIFANWRAVGVLWGALIFGGVAALQLRLQTMGLQLPYELFLALPYLVTILALIIAGRNASAPAALLKAYRRE